MNRFRGKKLMTRLVTYVVLIVTVFIISIPNIYMMGTAFKTKKDALADFGLLPKSWSFQSVYNVLANTTFGRNILNSIFIALTVSALCLVLASTAAYVISRFKSPLFSAYLVLLLILQLFPIVLSLIPLFTLYQTLNLYNTRMSLLLSYTSVNLPFSIWMLKSIFDSVPFEIEQAAMIDGATRLKCFLRIVIPLSLPGLATVAIFAFVNCWNEFTLVSVLIKDSAIYTLTMGLQMFREQFNSDWAALMAAATIATVPTIIFLLFAQKYIVSGLTSGAVKG